MQSINKSQSFINQMLELFNGQEQRVLFAVFFDNKEFDFHSRKTGIALYVHLVFKK